MPMSIQPKRHLAATSGNLLCFRLLSGSKLFTAMIQRDDVEKDVTGPLYIISNSLFASDHHLIS